MSFGNGDIMYNNQSIKLENSKQSAGARVISPAMAE